MIAIALVLALQQIQAPSGQPSSSSDQPPPATATIRGHVFGGDNGQPLRKAQVRLVQIDGAPGVSATQGRENRLATTDADGKYEFANLPAGRYNLTSSKGSYVSLSWGQRQPNEPGKPLEIHNAETVERVDFTLSRGGVVTGRIVDEFGEPISGIQVAAVRSQVVNGRRQMMPTGRSASTNDLGEFRLFAVMPGQYYIQATWRRMGPNVNQDTLDRVGYPVTYFPGTTDADSAQRFTIAANKEISDVTMALSPIKVARVEGTVVDSSGHPLGSTFLQIMQVSSSGMPTFGSGAMVRPDGGFTFPTLAPGDYVLSTQPNQGTKEFASMKITVGAEDITDLRLVTTPPSVISGRVVVDPAEAQSLPKSLMITANGMDPMMPNFGREPAHVSDDLSFELNAAAGRTRIVAINLPPTWTVRAIRVNAVDVIDDGIDVKTGEGIDGVEVELTTKVTTASGLVTDSRGEPVKDYTAIFFPMDDKRWGAGSRYLRIARPDQDGRFKVSGLPPGEYNIIALDKIEAGQNTDPDFLESIRSRATTFSLMEGETKTLDLKVTAAQ